MSLLFLFAIAMPLVLFASKLAGRVLGFGIGLVVALPVVLVMGALKRKRARQAISNVRN